jgi:hypothetical protein
MGYKVISKGMLVAVAVSLLLSVMVLGCKQATSGDSTPTVETVKWGKTSDNYLELKTNDSQYLGKYFATVYDTKPATAATTLSIDCKKVSGYSDSGLGMVLFGDSAAENFYEIEITPTGYFECWKKIGGSWVSPAVLSRTQSSHINKGLGSVNTISVSLTDSGTKTYTLSINSNIVATFTNTDCDQTGFYGFYAPIASAENETFPDTPEDMLFKRIAPTN